VRIAHEMPGRVRLRIDAPIAPEDVVAAVRALSGVQRAEWSPRTRGLLVLYTPGSTSAGAIVDAVHEAAALDPPRRPGPEPPDAAEGTATARPPATLAAAVIATGRELDRAVRLASAGAVGLGGVVPAALVLWALLEIGRGRTAPLAWSSALWYAHGLFRDYNAPSS
jgi:hypothetical protein